MMCSFDLGCPMQRSLCTVSRSGVGRSRSLPALARRDRDQERPLRDKYPLCLMGLLSYCSILWDTSSLDSVSEISERLRGIRLCLVGGGREPESEEVQQNPVREIAAMICRWSVCQLVCS